LPIRYAIVKIHWSAGNNLCRYIAFVCRQTRVIRLFLGNTVANTLETAVQHEFPSARHQVDLLPKLQRELINYFKGQPVTFNCQIDMSWASAFGRKVLRHCSHIPVGKTISYGQLAQNVGHPGAARAVGNIMARNRVPIIIPCHRVISSDGSLGGYSAAGGTTMKKLLLSHEAAFSNLIPTGRYIIHKTADSNMSKHAHCRQKRRERR
jgi:methylated-DNA-[protein]-cysteine S-methyltransferase